MYEVIFFYGPRHSGKTAYYWQQLALTHARVSAGEVYRKKPLANLHVVIKHFISTLKQKRLVVVDDENWSAETRQSYVRAINKQEFDGGCNISCFEFSPYHGKQQCLWTAQWALAGQEAWLISHTCSRTAHTEENSIPSTVSITNAHIPDYASTTSVIYRSFTPNSSIRPSKAEGFGEVYNIESRLMCISQYEFTIPTLLIQWECLVGVAGPAVMEACHHWQTAHTEGRVIVMCNNQNNSHNDWKESTQDICKLLEKYPQLVMYYIMFAGTLSHMIAWLQFRHTICLYHSATVYVWSSEAHRDCAKSLGIINMNVDYITSKPKAITCVHHSTDGPPLMLKNFLYCCPDQHSGMIQDSGIYEDTCMNTWTSTGASKSGTKDTSKNYHLPLFELAQTLHQCDTSANTLSFSFDSKKKQCFIISDTLGSRCYHVITDVDKYCTHVLLYNTWSELCQYQQHTVDKIVIVTNKNCSGCFTKKSWEDNIMKEKEKKMATTLSVLSPLVPAKKHKATSLLSPRNNRSNRRAIVFPVLTHEELLSHAVDNNTYARAEAYQDNVFDVNCTRNGHGTGANPYKLQCTVSSSGMIVGSSCSCPIGSTSDNKCKHVIAMLLVYMKQRQVNKATPRALPVAPAADTHDEEKETGTLTRHRSLPKWVSEMQPPVEDEVPPVKKRKRNENESSTKYKLTDEDLMKTALEILEEPDVTADADQETSVMPSVVKCLPSVSADGSDSEGTVDGIGSATTQMGDDNLTQEIDQTVINVPLSPDQDSDHRHGNSDFTNDLGEKIQSSLFYDGDDGQDLIADSLPPIPIHDKTHDNCDGHCDKPVDSSDNILDELFG